MHPKIDQNHPNASLPKSLLHLNNLDVVLEGRQILSDINWTLNKGENWAFLGGNGAGKTTLIRLIRGEIWPSPSSRGSRMYCLNGETQSAPIGVRKMMPIVSADLQDLYCRNRWRLNCEDVVYTGLTDSVWLFQPPNAAQKEEAEAIMELLGAEHLKKRSFLELSRGEARKILIARAMITHPPILVLDEFCNGLDAPTRKTMFSFLEAVTQSGTQIVYVTHRLNELPPSITHILRLENGRIIQQGPRDEFRDVLASQDPPLIHRLARTIPDHEGSKPNLSTSHENGQVLIEIKNADIYRKHRKVLHNLHWKMKANENWAVLGGNGAGKSTFLSLLYGGLHPALGGRIERFGSSDSKNSVWDLRKKIGFLSAHLQADYEYNLTGEEAILSGFHSSIGLWEESTDDMKNMARRWIEFLGIEPLAQQNVHTLSYGQFRKILLARALVQNPSVLLLDEPCNGLDRSSKIEFLELLESLAQTQTCIVFVTHHPEELIPSITHAMTLDRGRITAQGDKARILANGR
ncbi:MAG: ATP-binding cassette domain-containing protein [Candidatus Omnitrophica bacterium]|nr:ATP-binding cassette domain-containing protein [Candidatus Omnitrophota bacterium]